MRVRLEDSRERGHARLHELYPGLIHRREAFHETHRLCDVDQIAGKLEGKLVENLHDLHSDPLYLDRTEVVSQADLHQTRRGLPHDDGVHIARDGAEFVRELHQRLVIALHDGDYGAHVLPTRVLWQVDHETEVEQAELPLFVDEDIARMRVRVEVTVAENLLGEDRHEPVQQLRDIVPCGFDGVHVADFDAIHPLEHEHIAR